MQNKKKIVAGIGAALAFGLLAPVMASYGQVASIVQTAEAASALPQQERVIVVTGTVQTKAGAAKDWDPTDMATRMQPMGEGFYQYSCELPEGRYYYKISVNGSWAENYGLGGAFDGANVQLTLAEPTHVAFYYNDETHQIRDSTQYQFLQEEELPRLTGDFAAAGTAEPRILRDKSLDRFYETKLFVQPGTYQAVVQQQGQPDFEQTVTVRKAGEASFYYDQAAGRLICDDGSIEKEAIVHDTWSEMCRRPFEAVPAGRPVELAVMTRVGEVQKAELSVTRAQIVSGGGDEYNPDYSSTPQLYPMRKIATQDGKDIWQARLTPQESGLYGYKFVLDGTVEYGDDAKSGHTGEAKLRAAKPFQLTVYEKDFQTPDWAKEAVVYQIFPDRFFNGDTGNDTARTQARGFQPLQQRVWHELPANHSKTPDKDGDEWECNDFFGGDLAGITAKLDYLQELGITAIYLNPIMDACSNHRYDAVDYGTLDPLLGTQADFQRLVREMQKRGMHLIMDGVFNHVGDDSVYFDRYGKYPTVGAYEYWSRVYGLMEERGLAWADAQRVAREELAAEGQVFSPYQWENWFDIYPEKGRDMMGAKYKYHDWQGYDSLVAFRDSDYTDAGSMLGSYLLNGKDAVLTKWFGEGLSGWRLDVAKEVPPSFWQAVRRKVKQQRTVDGQEPLLLGEIWQDGSQFLTGDQFDSVMNYKLSFALGDLYLGQGQAEALDAELKILRQNYPREALYDLMNIVDSHDTVRAIYKLGGGQDGTAQPGAKDFDYELGKARLKLAVAFLMGYPGMPTIYYGDEAGLYGSADPDCRRTYPWGHEDKELVDYYRRAIGVRNSNKELFAHGSLETLLAEGDVYAFARAHGEAHAIVALNRGPAREVALKVAAADGTVFEDGLTGKRWKARQGQLKVRLGQNQALMLVKR